MLSCKLGAGMAGMQAGRKFVYNTKLLRRNSCSDAASFDRTCPRRLDK